MNCIGKSAPTFKAPAVHNEKIIDLDLESMKGKGRYAVIFFYPKDFTFVCPTEITAYSDALDKFNALKCDVMAVSTDSEHAHLAWVKASRKDGGVGGLRIPLVADPSHSISKAYGVLREGEGIADRGLFILDSDHIIRHITCNDLGIGRSVDETLRLVEAIQFNQQHGEVCPANWVKGGKTIVPTPDGSKTYFGAAN